MTAAPLLAVLLAASPTSGAAPPPPPIVRTTTTPAAPAEGPDVELHVPRAEVQKVSIEVENLQTHLDLDTRVANLVQISAGVVATVGKLKVDLEGVQAETHLVVRLERVAQVLERALAAVDAHPDLAGGPQAAAPGPAQGPVVIPAGGARPGTRPDSPTSRSTP